MRSSSTSFYLVLAIILYANWMSLGDGKENVCYKLISNVDCPNHSPKPKCESHCKKVCGPSSTGTCVDSVEYTLPKCACQFQTTDDCTTHKVC
ncbi:hypothetical protein Leryth_003913 [Lithospermum erythrorhizon]|nr:hypothetical protein Leryth_003913 [Lithospermum erythrorhizon]